MENKAKIGFLILLIFYIILAESEMWGPVIITGDTPAEAILKLSNTPAAVSAESVLVKRYDSTVSSYPINNIKTTKIQWDSVTSKPTAYNPVLHQHDSIYYRETEVNNLLSSKSDTSHTHPQYKINGLVDTITNHRNAIASKFATADTNKLAQKSHIHVISNVLGLNDTITNHRTAIASKLNISDTSSLARKNHGHSQSQITGLVDTVTAHRNAINNKQPLDTDLTTIAGLTHSNRHVMVSNGSSWTRRALEEADLPSLSSAKLPSNIVYTDNIQTIFGAKTFSANATFAGSIIGSGSAGLFICNNTTDGSDTKTLLLSGGGSYQSTRGATIALRGNESTDGYGNLELIAGGGNGTITGAVRVNPRMYFGTRPANDHRWTLALDQYNTFYGSGLEGSGMNIMHNLYHDGSSWRYRYGSGSKSGGVLTTLAYNQFSVSVAGNGVADGIATLTPAIFTNLNGNTAFGKNSFVGGNRLEVEGNTLVNGTLTVNVIPAKTTEVGVYLTHENNTIKTRTAAQVRGDIGAAALIHTHPWADITDKPSTFAPAAHGLVSSTHTVSGLTAGHVLKALSATTYGFAAITPANIGAPAIGTERSLSITTAGWVTIATCATGRAYGEFHVYDYTGSRHNFTKIIASTSYGQNNVSVIGGNRFYIRSIAHVRILYNTSDRIYGGAKLQVYCENPTFTLYVKQFLSQEFTNWKAWNNVTPVAEGTPTGWAQDDSTYLQDITNPNHSFIGNVFSGKGLLLSGNATITGNSETKGYSLFKNFTEHWEDVFLHKGIQLLNKAGTSWLNFVTRDVSGSEAKFRLSNISGLAMEAASPFLTISPYSNGGIVFNTPSSPSGQHAHLITRSANDGVLKISREVNGEGSLMMAFSPTVNEILFNSDINFSHKNLFDVCLSSTVSYNGISIIITALGPINTDNCPGIYLDPTPSSSHDFTLTGGVIDQRIFVRNGSTHVQYVDGCRIEPGEFRDFLKTGTGWTASGASISGKTIYVSSGTGNISVSNVSTVHINYTPTSTYTLTDGYVGQRVTVVVLSGSAQHWIQGATKAHKIVAGEFRDFIYTTAGWVASAADY